MRRLLKLLAVVLVSALLSQTPFIYRRYQLGRLDAKIRELNAARQPPDDPVYADHKGAIHVHSFLGGHSTGTFAEITRAAQTNNLAFVVMTEHPSGDFDTRALTLKGVRGGVLFVQGNETSESAEDRLLTFGGGAATGATTSETAGAATTASTQESINRAKATGALVFIAHPETFRSWGEASGFDGMEIYNLHADAKNINRLALFFDGLWSYRSYPHLLWTRFYAPPEANLRRFDELTATQGVRRKVVAIAGNDAHANIGLSLRQLTGKPLLELKLDPYERSFQVVRTHVLVERTAPLSEANLLNALAHGHAYVAFDILCDASGFRFNATNGTEQNGQKLMGDEMELGSGVRLQVATPVRSRIVLVRNGRVVREEKESDRLEWTTTEAGVFRVVCYLPQLPAPLDAKPWIISNPIYVR